MSRPQEKFSRLLGKVRSKVKSRKAKLLLLFTFQTLLMLYGWFGLSNPQSPRAPVAAHEQVQAIEARTMQV